MSDIERELQRAPLARPSTNLDQRMQTLFGAGAAARPHPWHRPVPVWLAAAACLGWAAVGFGVRSLLLRAPTPPAVVVVVQPNEALRQLVAGSPPGGNDGIDFSRARIQTTTASPQQL